MSSQQWRNINCYAIDQEGKSIALGTYSGAIIVLTVITATKVTEMELKRHRNCVMHISFSHNKKIFSVSYDKIFITTTIETNSSGQKTVAYSELQLETVPRSIEAICDLPHLLENQGLFWIA